MWRNRKKTPFVENYVFKQCIVEMVAEGFCSLQYLETQYSTVLCLCHIRQYEGEKKKMEKKANNRKLLLCLPFVKKKISLATFAFFYKTVNLYTE
uniref:Uncharacterized protein n=1 Tax=Anguilla anguilla TaxID=7936 RepID=A0A0E9X5K9_ANGAN